MSLFKSKFKKVEPQNISVSPQAETPKVVEPKMPSPMVIAEISKSVLKNMTEQPTELSIMNKELDNKLGKKIEEVELEIKVKQEVLKILRGI